MIDRERHPDREEPTRGMPENTPGTSGQGSSGFSTSRGTESADPGGNVVDMAKQRGNRAGGDVQEKTGEMVDKARRQASSRLSGQMDRAAENLSSVAHAVRQTGVQLRSQEGGSLAEYADKAADQIERLSGYLRENGVEDVARETEQFARRQPLLFLGGAFIAGFLGARFLKSSRPSAGLPMEYGRGEVGPRYYGGLPYQPRPGFGGQGASGRYPARGVPTQPGPTTGTGPNIGPGQSGFGGPSAGTTGTERRPAEPPAEHTEKEDEAA